MGTNEINTGQERLQQQQKDSAVGVDTHPLMLSDELLFLDRIKNYRNDNGESDYGC